MSESEAESGDSALRFCESLPLFTFNYAALYIRQTLSSFSALEINTFSILLTDNSWSVFPFSDGMVQ